MTFSVGKNNFYEKPKSGEIETPSVLAEYLFELLSPHIPCRIFHEECIFDPAAGRGNLLEPWQRRGYWCRGVEIRNVDELGLRNDPVYFGKDKLLIYPSTNYFTNWKGVELRPRLVICNPPFNLTDDNRDHVKGRPLMPELFLDKIIADFGKDVPIALFVPIGFRLNLTEKSARWQKLVDGTYPPISSVISLPKDVFPGVVFHAEILIFNVPNLRVHYFYEPRKESDVSSQK